ncbi:YolD-like family protein [Oceanobacillus sp. J11TS1]|uniref:YolD-like family protein n=1 Tax=Oceanobacillus sp. J11TS1 TaxID=2807191 RepID=UPI001B039B45|nr:YolD-like family protein [Oceanobacillus sp. J11TS1]GIO22410.1 hypothetical protein J11TS1_09910 [Oceanobacillus sp. J11TS1]
MEIRDRGTMKWTSLMLPEQVELLRKMREERDRKEKPILDEQQIEENGFQLMMAHKDNLLVEIKHYKDYDFRFYQGYIDRINYQDKYINVVEKLGGSDFVKIKFEDIMEVHIL